MPARTCQYGIGYDLDVGDMIANAPQVYDVGLNDHTTYYEHSNNLEAAVTVIWDLGEPSTVTRLVASHYYMDNASILYLYGSNDGVSWTFALTGIIPGIGSGDPGSWSDYDGVNIDTTLYRYWKTSIRCNTMFWPDPMIARVGDFRLFNGAVQYTVGGTDDARVIHNGNARVVLAPFPVQNIEYCIATALWHAHKAAGILRRRTKKLWRTISSFAVRHPSPAR